MVGKYYIEVAKRGGTYRDWEWGLEWVPPSHLRFHRWKHRGPKSWHVQLEVVG